MRIDGSSRTQAAAYRAASMRGDAAPAFSADPGPAAPSAAGAGPVSALTGMDALLALQAADDPLRARRKAVRRGTALLDTLDSIKSDLLLGRVSEGRLNQLLAVVGQARERTLPGLDSLLDDIELRARVELAKFGRFAGA